MFISWLIASICFGQPPAAVKSMPSGWFTTVASCVWWVLPHRPTSQETDSTCCWSLESLLHKHTVRSFFNLSRCDCTFIHKLLWRTWMCAHFSAEKPIKILCNKPCTPRSSAILIPELIFHICRGFKWLVSKKNLELFQGCMGRNLLCVDNYELESKMFVKVLGCWLLTTFLFLITEIILKSGRVLKMRIFLFLRF